MASLLFGSAAVVQALLAACFTLRVCKLLTAESLPRLLKLINGQRKDDLLAWLGALATRLDLKDLLLRAGTALGWLCMRTASRLRALAMRAGS